MTDTELKVMAALAIIGLSSSPNTGYSDAGRHGHAERVVDEREEQVLADVASSSPAEPRARTSPRRSPLHQGDAGALHRDVGPGAHRDPTSACARAGASLMPSPAIATRGPRLQALDDGRLLIGQHLGLDLSMPTAFATASAVIRLSPVSITTAIPSSCRP
jgi:hypothetical protein